MKIRPFAIPILCLLLLCACVSAPENDPKDGSASAIVEAAAPKPIPEDAVDFEPSASAKPAATSVPDKTAAPTAADAPSLTTPAATGTPDAFRLDAPVQCPAPGDAQRIPVTVRESYRKTGDTVSTMFAGHTLDFSALSFSVTSLDAADSGTTVSISVDFPPAWSNAEIHSLLLYLGFSLSLDGETASDFRLISQTPLPALSQIENRVDRAEYRYRSESLTVEKLYGRRALSIVPYVDYRETMPGGKANGQHDVDLLAGETCTFNGSEYRYTGLELRRTVDALSVTIPLPAAFSDLPPAAETSSPLLLPVTLWEEDWEKNADAGKYKGNPSFYYGSFRNETYDFGGLRFDLEKAVIWENGFRIVCRLILPDSWSDGQRSAFLAAKHGGSNLQIQLRVDGVEENFHGFLMVPAGFRSASYDERSPNVPRELFCVCEENAAHFEALLNAGSVHISLYAVYADSVSDEETRYDLTGGAPVYIDNAQKWRTEQKTLLRAFDLPLNDFIGIKEVQK